MDTVHFVTITGIDHYYGKTPFEIGRITKIVKEPDNPHDSEAIRVELPFIGTTGYVRIYDKIGDYAYARVFFVTHSSVIALVLSPEEVEDDDAEKKEIFIVEEEAEPSPGEE